MVGILLVSFATDWIFPLEPMKCALKCAIQDTKNKSPSNVAANATAMLLALQRHIIQLDFSVFPRLSVVLSGLLLLKVEN